MEQFEKVEKLREKANVSYEEAKEALEASNWDILDAIVYLEKLGKVKEPKTAAYTTGTDNSTGSEYKTSQPDDGTSFSELIGKFFKWCGKVIKKGNENSFVIRKGNDTPVCLPVTVFVLLVFFAFWVTIPLLIVGLFFGFKFSFKGPDLEKNAVNDFMDKASYTAESIKDDFKSGMNKEDK